MNQIRRGRRPITKEVLSARQLRLHQERFQRNQDHELCIDLARKFARQAARPKDVAELRLRFSDIAAEFRCLRPANEQSLSSRRKKTLLAAIACASTKAEERSRMAEYLRAIEPTKYDPPLVFALRDRFRDDAALKCLLARIEDCAKHHLGALNHGKSYDAKIGDCELGSRLMSSLADAILWNREALIGFLLASFRRWRQIDLDGSTWRWQTVTHQIATILGHDRRAILRHLQEIRAIPSKLTPDLEASWLQRIGQYLSRSSRIART